MKKLVLFLALVMASHSFAQSNVSKADYQKLDNQEKRISDYVDCAIAGLRALKLNGSNYSNYQATISINAKERDKLGNFIAIGLSEAPVITENIQSCTICGVTTGILCYKRIKTILENGGGTVIITVVLNSEGCGVLSW